jgi:hypothetical protein
MLGDYWLPQVPGEVPTQTSGLEWSPDGERFAIGAATRLPSFNICKCRLGGLDGNDVAGAKLRTRARMTLAPRCRSRCWDLVSFDSFRRATRHQAISKIVNLADAHVGKGA